MTCVINVQYKQQIMCLTTPGRIGPTSHLKHVKYIQKRRKSYNTIVYSNEDPGLTNLGKCDDGFFGNIIAACDLEDA